ncbi:MAG: hypothetical protein HY791_08045 [Deltaproteobacteria bacterium]|nr:hypothetical protein [Deltaproteobacteria bacterium]
MKKTMLTGSLALSLATGCGNGADSFRDALPTKDVVEVSFPEGGASSRGLVGTTSSGLVGGPADFYTHSYYASRQVNGFAGHVVRAIQDVASHTPTQNDGHVAVWGPFSANGEPVEYKLTVAEEGDRFDWVAEIKHKSADQFSAMAAGSFVPGLPEEGMGWFAVDFEVIREANPAEGHRGQIAYSFERTSEGLAVRAFAREEQNGQNLEAGYAYGRGPDGSGFVMFSVPENFKESGDLGMEDTGAKERMLIHTRWTTIGAGRADVLVSEGDLGGHAVVGTQCWNDRYASTFEAMSFDGSLQAADGDPSGCAEPEASVPDPEDVPVADDVLNPYGE